MIILLEESKRYLPYFEKASGERMTACIESTPCGDVACAKNDNVIWISNIGTCPLGIAWIMDHYHPDGLGMVSKVGGINKLLSVGDIMLVSDYIDNTTCRPKSYIEKKDKSIKIRYAMGNPFCQDWAENVKNHLMLHRKEYPGNFMDTGVYVCTDGPGFESDSEINLFRNWGADMVGHWISPFVYYARELDVCFVSVGVVSNVFHKNDQDMLNDDKTNTLFGELYAALLQTKPKKQCNCQKNNIIAFEEYEF